MSYIAFIASIRDNEKLSLKKVFKRALIKAFGKEYKENALYIDAVRGSLFTDILSFWKLINPFKWLEFLVTLLADVVDRTCQIGANPPGKHGDLLVRNGSDIGLTTDTDDIGPTYGFFRSFIRGVFKLAVGLPAAILQHFTSPINQIYRPLVQYAQKHPIKFWLLVVTAALLITAFIALAVLSGGTLPSFLGFLAVIPGVVKGISAIATAATFIGTHLPFIAPAVGMILSKILFISTSFVAALRLAHHVVANFVSSFRDLIHLGKPTKLANQAKGAFSIGDTNSGENNVLSRLMFNTEKDIASIHHYEQECSFGSLFTCLKRKQPTPYERVSQELDEVRNDVKDATHAVKGKIKKAGRAVRGELRDVGRELKDGARSFKRGVNDAGREVERAIEDDPTQEPRYQAEDTRIALKRAGEDIETSTRRGYSDVIRTFTRCFK